MFWNSPISSYFVVYVDHKKHMCTNTPCNDPWTADFSSLAFLAGSDILSPSRACLAEPSLTGPWLAPRYPAVQLNPLAFWNQRPGQVCQILPCSFFHRADILSWVLYTDPAKDELRTTYLGNYPSSSMDLEIRQCVCLPLRQTKKFRCYHCIWWNLK